MSKPASKPIGDESIFRWSHHKSGSEKIANSKVKLSGTANGTVLSILLTGDLVNLQDEHAALHTSTILSIEVPLATKPSKPLKQQLRFAVQKSAGASVSIACESFGSFFVKAFQLGQESNEVVPIDLTAETDSHSANYNLTVIVHGVRKALSDYLAITLDSIDASFDN